MAAVVALIAAASAGAAQQVRAPASPIAAPQVPAPAARTLSIAWSGPLLTAAEATRLAAIVARADTAAAENRVSDAARLYWSVVAQQRVAAEYPDVALRRLAVMYYGANEEYIAAEVFMELAEAAAEFGDATTRLRSLFDAALMYQHLGRADRVAECARHMWPLFKSAAIPESIRSDILARMNQR